MTLTKQKAFSGYFGVPAFSGLVFCRPLEDVRGFERQGYCFWQFQLESLILAQNERWRQA